MKARMSHRQPAAKRPDRVQMLQYRRVRLGRQRAVSGPQWLFQRRTPFAGRLFHRRIQLAVARGGQCAFILPREPNLCTRTS
jgi:hypothetical protein